MELYDLKKNIYNEINLLSNNDQINQLNEFIQLNDMPRSSNLNGTFINLTVLDENHIHLLSDFLLKNKDNKVTDLNLENDFKNEFKTISNELSNYKKKKTITKLKIKNTKVTQLEKQIIKFSY
tara:strand:- start:1096 stop:1464 length:369 start_codon:yes stop_codon:yes gene_type:complete